MVYKLELEKKMEIVKGIKYFGFILHQDLRFKEHFEYSGNK